MNISKILFSFIIIIIIAVSSAVFTILTMKKLSINTQKIYTHPFKVTRAVINIKTNIITMHRNMKDIVLTKDYLEIIKIIEEVQKLEHKTFLEFEIIYQKYLGDKNDIDKVYNSFKNWKKTRQKVIENMYQKNYKDAIEITKNEGVVHINKLYNQINTLENFALTKADEFYNSSIKNNNVNSVIAVFLLTLIISILIVFYITTNLLKIGKVNNKQLHLIDQNILMATFSLDGKITYISNALCHLLNQSKEELLNSTNKYFFTDKKQFLDFKNIINLGKEYKGEITIPINNEQTWFKIEIFPELSSNYKLSSFNVFFTNINDKKQIEKISITDKLTNLYNRNYFELIFEKEIRRSKREKNNLSVIMFDIDFFKQYNDTYGHQEGDNALKAVARVFALHTNRSYDYAFRTGGEEFILISYDKNIEELKSFVAKILDEIRALKISHKKSTVSNYLTLSAGVALFDTMHLLSAQEMYKEVDDLLYEAKKDGRNCFKHKFIK